MKTSILIIAYNEEKYIARCIESVLKQTKTADEIVLIAHNCTDATESIAHRYPAVRVISYNGPEGVPFARIKGFQEVTGDIVACIDGDSAAHKKWFERIIAPLKDNRISLVAGYVILTNNFFARVTSFWQFVIRRKCLRLSRQFAWGSNFCCRKSDYEKVGGFEPIVELREKLKLHFWAEDVLLSAALGEIGKIYFALGAKTWTKIPQWKLDPKTAPLQEWREDNNSLFDYFEGKKGISVPIVTKNVSDN